MICDFLCDKMNTICSIKVLDNALNIVYNKLTRRYSDANRGRDVFLTFTGRKARFLPPVTIRNTQYQERI